MLLIDLRLGHERRRRRLRDGALRRNTVGQGARFRRDKRRSRTAGLPIRRGRLADQAIAGETEAFWETEYRQQLVGRALELMQNEFQQNTWRACWEVVVSVRSAADVAADLGISVDSVYAAKSRVLRRLRKELEGLLD